MLSKSGKTGPKAMATIMTGAAGNLAYWEGSPFPLSGSAFDKMGNFQRPDLTSFACLSAFADNSNHAPWGFDGAITWDAGVNLLFRIAGAH